MAREPNENKEKALQAALSQIERQFGKGSMMRLGDREQIDILDLHGLPGSGYRARNRRPAAGSDR